MYERTFWLDHVVSPADTFRITANGDGTYLIERAGTVQQQGTNQDQLHFNKMEEGIVDAQVAIELLINHARQNAWEVEHGTVNLTNSAAFPFNNSQVSVPLVNCKDSTDYVVLAEVQTFNGNVGNIIISDKLVNGFKIAYDGSAKSAVIKYTVIGGYLK